jgi:thermitase
MKPHIILKLTERADDVAVPHWQEIITDKAVAASRIHPRVDALFSRHRLPVWVTREYRPAGAAWSREEVTSGLNRIYRLILQQDTEIPPDLIQAIRLLPVVEEVRVGRIGQVDLPPMQATQLSAMTDIASRQAIYLDEAQRFTRGHPAVTIAVLDTGISLDHPELAEVLMPGFDFVDIIDGATQFIGDFVGADEEPQDEVGHGTHVAGIIAAKGIAMPGGVAPRCRVLPVRVLAALQRGGQLVGAGLVDNINAGVKWAVDQGADVINMSLGVRHTEGGLPHQEVVDYAGRRGVTIVAAAGNDGSEQLYYPGAFESVIAVGAMDEGGEVAAFSTFGRQISLVAPGTNIYSSYLDRDYAFASGTSHAAPFVSGAVALLKSYARSNGRELSDRQVKHVLKHTADKVDQRFKHHKAGYGRLNLVDALRLLQHKLN